MSVAMQFGDALEGCTLLPVSYFLFNTPLMWCPYSGLSAPCFGAAIVNNMVGLFQGQQRIIHCTVSILLIFFFFRLSFVCECFDCLYVCTKCAPGVCGSQKRLWDPLGLVL